MRIIFATDLHGSQQKYERLFDVAKDFRADVVINSGDMLPITGGIISQMSFINYNLDQHFEKFNSAGIHYLCYLGNDDLRIFDQMFEETCNKYPLVENIAQRKVSIKGYEFIGMNWVADYPFALKDRCRMDMRDYVFPRQMGKGLLSSSKGWQELDDWPSYARSLPTIEDELNRLVRPEYMRKSVYVIHMPPCGLGLDRCRTGEEVGSRAVYDYLYNNQPLLSLHGHIHESPNMTGKWRATLGKTVCVQPGQAVASLIYVSIDLERMSMERVVSK